VAIHNFRVEKKTSRIVLFSGKANGRKKKKILKKSPRRSSIFGQRRRVVCAGCSLTASKEPRPPRVLFGINREEKRREEKRRKGVTRSVPRAVLLVLYTNTLVIIEAARVRIRDA